MSNNRIFIKRYGVHVRLVRMCLCKVVDSPPPTPVLLCALLARIKIPDKGIGETEMDLQSALRKVVANFLRRSRLRRGAEFRSVYILSRPHTT